MNNINNHKLIFLNEKEIELICKKLCLSTDLDVWTYFKCLDCSIYCYLHKEDEDNYVYFNLCGKIYNNSCQEIIIKNIIE